MIVCMFIVCMYTYVCMYACMYVCMYVYMCVCNFILTVICTTCVGAGDNRLANFRFRQVSTYMYSICISLVYAILLRMSVCTL